MLMLDGNACGGKQFGLPCTVITERISDLFGAEDRRGCVLEMRRQRQIQGGRRVKSSWYTSIGPPWSRANWAITAAELPPPESPATAMRSGSPPSSATCSPTQRSAAHESSIPAGHGIVDVQVTDRPATAVVEHHHGRVPVVGTGRPVDPDRHVAAVAEADHPSSIRMAGNISGGTFN